jgi:glycosyltransferase involved in cell wall biosynthesis
MSVKKLMVFITDPLSEIIRKGELTERYYNPGDLFDEIHIWMINADRPDPALLRKMAGKAELHIRNLPISKKVFLRSMAWRPWLLENWARPAVDAARQIRPDLVRCHDNQLNGIPPLYIKKRLGIPYIVSLHTHPDAKANRVGKKWKDRLLGKTTEAVEKAVLRNADRVLPVYRSIIPYLKRLGVKEFEVAYNVINPNNLGRKSDFRLHAPVRIISVGRQLPAKNPENIIKAMRSLPEAHLTVVGDGPWHGQLEATAKLWDVESRVTFLRAVPNDELCASLPDYDICASHSEYAEISKVVLETLLTGMPLVINRRQEEPVPELDGDFVSMVPNTEEGYSEALRRLIREDPFREGLGRRAYAHARGIWSPEKTESNYVRIYQEVMGGKSSLKSPDPLTQMVEA